MGEYSIMNPSDSVPIPSRRDIADRDFIDLENSQSPLYADVGLIAQVQSPESYDQLWLNQEDQMLPNEVLTHMDDDDIFQVDKADLIQPTLAELNANDETLLGDLNFDDLLLPDSGFDKSTPFVQVTDSNFNNNSVLTASSCPSQGLIYYKEIEMPGVALSNFDYDTKPPISAFSAGSQTSSNSSLVHSASSPLHSSLQPKHSTLHELLLKREQVHSPENSQIGQPAVRQDVKVHSPLQAFRQHSSRLSSSAPTQLGFEQLWQRREPRPHLLSTGSLAEATSTSSLSTGEILSPDLQDFSHDELGSDEDSDVHYEDFSSDSDEDHDENGGKSSNKKERYFWQYNLQSKGPKGQRLVMKSKMEDPHVLHEVTDPVFSPDCSVRVHWKEGITGIKHSGKARKGDGNDLTPNPRKLNCIGKELDNLSRIINEMVPVSELPFPARPTSRKEKNKLASRACRLKKKAQHEANKIKLSGLESEHRRLINGIMQAKQLLLAKLSADQSSEKQEEITGSFEKILKNCQIKVAGHTTDYVNKILDRNKGGSGIVEDL